MLNGRVTCSVKEEYVVRLERNDTRIGWLVACEVLGLRNFAKLRMYM